MPKKKESVSELKDQLKELQGKISSLEQSHKKQPEENQPEPRNESFKVVTLYAWNSPERLFIPRNRK